MTVVNHPATVMPVMAVLQLLRAECARQVGGWAAVSSQFVRQRRTLDGASVAFVLFVLSALARAEPGALALTHVTVIDGTGADPQPDRTVLISADRIASITQSAPPEGARVIDARGKFLIPGLCDMHVHLAGVTADPKWSKTTLLPLLIANGVTTVRDMGGDLIALQTWRKEIGARSLIGPRIYCPGPMLDGGKSDPPALLGISPDEGRTAVRHLKAKGADFIKVLSGLDRKSYFAIAVESKKQGMTFVGHVPNALRALEVSDAGQKSIEHIFYSNLTFDCSAREAELRKKSAEARAQRDNAGAAGLAMKPTPVSVGKRPKRFGRHSCGTRPGSCLRWSQFRPLRGSGSWPGASRLASRISRLLCGKAGRLTKSKSKLLPRRRNGIRLNSKTT